MAKTNAPLVMASARVATCELGDGLALLDLTANQYYSLNKVGAFVWSVIQSPITVDDVCLRVAQRYAVTREQCRADVDALLSSLDAAGLVRIDDAVPAAADMAEDLSA